MSAAFYCVADERYFLGAVATINSLRVLGHDEPVHVLDAGLATAQREALASEAAIVHAPPGTPPWLLKTVAPLAHPAETMVLVDTDIIVTRSLAELIERAGEGRVVAFENNMDRHCPEWGEVLDLGPTPRRPYVSSAFIALSRVPGEELLSLVDDRQRVVDFQRTWWRDNEDGYPFLYADQDVINAVLAARLDPDRLVALDHRLAPIPPFEGLELVDAETLSCAYADGTEPYLVHHYVTKPWLEPTHDGVYSRMLRRLLNAGDVPIRIPASDLPLRLRRGPLAYADRRRIDLRERFRSK